MKIVVSGYIGKKVTGIGRNLMCLLNCVSTENQYVVYVNEDMTEELVFSKPNVEVKTYAVSKNKSFQNLLWTTFLFPFKVLQERADSALIPNFTLLLLKFKPTVVILCDLIEFNVPDKFSKLKMFYRTKLADPITVRVADKIITISENSKSDIMKFLKVKEKKITIVNSGVDQKKFVKSEEPVIKECLDKRGWPHKFLLYVGTIDHPGKNAMSVIKAFEKLKENSIYDGQLVLAGMPGEGFEIVEEYIRCSNCQKDIVITGYVTDEELIVLYSKCDVFCFLSLYEGFGIPPLEALACGAKVVVSNTSSLPEVVGEVGWTTTPEDLEEICATIGEALAYQKDAEYDEKVRKHLKKYVWEDLSKDFEKVLCK